MSAESGKMYQLVQGHPFPPDGRSWSREKIESGIAYQVKDTDKLIVTYPKNGTTWAQQICHLIENEAKQSGSQAIFCSAFLEMIGQAGLTYNWLIKSHLPYHLLSQNPKAKYLWVLRNPKDTCVSYYHHCIHVGRFQRQFSEFFKCWIEGEVPHGNYFDYVLAWWAHRDDPNVTLMLYEDMKKDPKTAIIQLAQFLGDDYYQKVKNNASILDSILKKSSIDYMKTEVEFGHLVRKGEVGDWRNIMTQEESDSIDEIVMKKFGGTGIELLWDEETMKWQ